MALSDVDIYAAIDSGDLKIEPIPGMQQITEASIDLHLGPTIRSFRGNPQGAFSVDLSKAKANDFVKYASDVIDLSAGPWTLNRSRPVKWCK